MNILCDSFEAYFPRQQNLNPFGKQQPPGSLSQILKNDLCQQAFFFMGENMLNFGSELLMERTKTW